MSPPLPAPPLDDPIVNPPGGVAMRRLLDALAAAERPLTAQEIADLIDRHHTGVRHRLSTLVRAGHVRAVTDPPNGRGRPATRFAIAALGPTESAVTHHRLLETVSGLVRGHDFDTADLRRFGESEGHALAYPGGGPAEVRRRLATLGFAPRTVPGCPGVLEQSRCPLVDLVERPGGTAVCDMHVGLADGLARGAGLAGARLQAAPPRHAHCRIVLDVAPDGADGE